MPIEITEDQRQQIAGIIMTHIHNMLTAFNERIGLWVLKTHPRKTRRKSIAPGDPTIELLRLGIHFQLPYLGLFPLKASFQ